MSEVADAARVVVILADYAAFDLSGRLGLLGGAFQLTQAVVPGPAGLGIPGHTVVVLIEVPQAHAGKQVAVTMTLRDASGDPVISPGMGDAPGQPIRMAQVQVLQRPQVNGIYVPETVPCRLGLTMAIPAGLPLRENELYRWTVHLDDQTDEAWSSSFYVVGVQPSPIVLG